MQRPFEFTNVEVGDWLEFSQLASALDTYWLFRGHRRAEWPISSALERTIERVRRTKPRASIGQAEEYLIEQFEREAHHYGLRFESHERFDLLAAMQHHGVPTRLVDFTSSIYVASFFAIANAEEDDSPCIWAISTRRIEKTLRAASAQLKNDSVRKQRVGSVIDRILASASDKTRAEAINDLFVHAREDSPTIGIIHGRPFRLSERLRQQHGAFLVPLRVEESFEANLAALHGLPADKAGVKLIAFRRGFDRDEFLTQFYRLNIDERALFPGVDGFARSLITKYEVMASQFFTEGRRQKRLRNDSSGNSLL